MPQPKELKPLHTPELMPVISLWQPFANWVALGWKQIETRTHTRFAGLEGKRIGIQASLTWDKTAIAAATPYLTPEQLATSNTFSRMGGAVICTAFVKEFRKLTEDDSRRSLINCGSVERYGLILEDVQIIEAIPCKGRQGIFYVAALAQAKGG